MNRSTRDAAEMWQRRAAEQRRWIEEHGGSLAGYVARYGSPGEPGCYGNGGEAIYHADVAALDEAEAAAAFYRRDA